MKAQFFILLALTAFIFACMHTRHVAAREYDGVNEALKGKKVKIMLAEGRGFTGRDVQIAQDSTFWRESKLGGRLSIATSEINYLVLTNRARGAADGFWMGFLIAGGIGLGGRLLNSGEGGYLRFSDDPFEDALATAFFAGTLYGLVLGLPIGAAVGSNERFVFSPP